MTTRTGFRNRPPVKLRYFTGCLPIKELGFSKLWRAPLKSKTFDSWLKAVTPSYRWDWPHLVYLREFLDRVTAGEITRLMIFMPPRHGKTEMVTIRYPVWRLERKAKLRVIIAAYNQILANKFSRKARKIARSRFPLSEERAAVEDWETPAGGGFRAIGVGSGITGQGGDLIIIDDPVKSREEADSLAYRDRVYEWFTDDLYTRLEPGGSIILIQTRWHEDDLAGRILKSDDGPNWTVVNLPAIAAENDPLGRQPGEALCPERYSEDALAEIRTALGERAWWALYMGQPRQQEGALIKTEKFILVDEPPACVRVARYWDLAAGVKTQNDYTAGVKVGVTDDGRWVVLDVRRGRWAWPDARRVIAQTAQLDGPDCVQGIEDVAFQRAAYQDLVRIPELGGVPLRLVRPQGDKINRAGAWAGRVEDGLFIVVRAEWTRDFLNECAAFPVGEHDDQVDAVSGAVQMLGRQPRDICSFQG